MLMRREVELDGVTLGGISIQTAQWRMRLQLNSIAPSGQIFSFLFGFTCIHDLCLFRSNGVATGLSRGNGEWGMGNGRGGEGEGGNGAWGNGVMGYEGSIVFETMESQM